jgi:hypothetical protein
MAYRIDTAIDIAADANTVWRVLTDFAAYPEWNPFIRSLAGSPTLGSRLVAAIQPAGQAAMTFRPVVQIVEAPGAAAPGKFAWLGKFLISGLFDGRHEFEIVSTATGVRFIQREQFSGVLVPLLWKKIGLSTEAGFHAMNQALKVRAESLLSKRA